MQVEEVFFVFQENCGALLMPVEKAAGPNESLPAPGKTAGFSTALA
jgi:hypothetical protein